MPAVTVPPRPNGLAYRDHPGARLGRVAVAQVDERQLVVGLHLQHGQVAALVVADDAGRQHGAVIHGDGDVGGAVDHVVVGDDRAVGVDQEARPAGLDGCAGAAAAAAWRTGRGTEKPWPCWPKPGMPPPPWASSSSSGWMWLVMETTAGLTRFTRLTKSGSGWLTWPGSMAPGFGCATSAWAKAPCGAAMIARPPSAVVASRAAPNVLAQYLAGGCCHGGSFSMSVSQLCLLLAVLH